MVTPHSLQETSSTCVQSFLLTEGNLRGMLGQHSVGVGDDCYGALALVNLPLSDFSSGFQVEAFREKVVFFF